MRKPTIFAFAALLLLSAAAPATAQAERLASSSSPSSLITYEMPPELAFIFGNSEYRHVLHEVGKDYDHHEFYHWTVSVEKEYVIPPTRGEQPHWQSTVRVAIGLLYGDAARYVGDVVGVLRHNPHGGFLVKSMKFEKDPDALAK